MCEPQEVDLWEAGVYPLMGIRESLERTRNRRPKMTCLQQVELVSLGTGQIRRGFTWTTNCVSSLYLSCLPPVHTDGVRKVVVELHEEFGDELLFEVNLEQSPTELMLDPPRIVQPQIGVLVIHYTFDFESYWSEGKKQRKRLAARCLHQGLLDAAAWANWDSAPFEEASQCVMENDFEFIGTWKEPKSSPNRKHKVQVAFHYDSDAIHLLFVFFDASGHEVFRGKVAELNPHDMSLSGPSGALGKLTWLDDRTVRLLAKDESQSWEIELPK